MPFVYHRTIRFQDTDAAGVVYFANLLAMAHEAYEASLAAAGVNLQVFFRNPAIALPIVHASADFLGPMRCGDTIAIHLQPEELSSSKFEITYQILRANGTLIGRAKTIHVAIYPGDPDSDGQSGRTRIDLSTEVRQWLALWSAPA